MPTGAVGPDPFPGGPATGGPVSEPDPRPTVRRLDGDVRATADDVVATQATLGRHTATLDEHTGTLREILRRLEAS